MTFNGAVERIAKPRSESEDGLLIVSFMVSIKLVYRIYRSTTYWHIYISLIKLCYASNLSYFITI